MIVLDSDHLSVLQHPDSTKSNRLVAKIDDSTDQDFATTVVSLEEQTRGWLAAINRKRDVHDQLPYYARLAGIVTFYGQWHILPFDESAADLFVTLRQSVRIGTMDLKIAAIAIVNDALMLSANLRDFKMVPGLRVESWLD